MKATVEKFVILFFIVNCIGTIKSHVLGWTSLPHYPHFHIENEGRLATNQLEKYEENSQPTRHKRSTSTRCYITMEFPDGSTKFIRPYGRYAWVTTQPFAWNCQIVSWRYVLTYTFTWSNKILSSSSQGLIIRTKSANVNTNSMFKFAYNPASGYKVLKTFASSRFVTKMTPYPIATLTASGRSASKIDIIRA